MTNHLVERAQLNAAPPGEPMIVCIVCRCYDTAPCLNGCFWTWMNELTGAGLCSQCAALPLEELESVVARARHIFDGVIRA